MKIKKIFTVILALFTVAMLFCSCSSSESTPAVSGSNSASSQGESAEHPRVKVKMENGGEFTIELYPEFAPETVENFLNLVNEGFYNGLTFHRVTGFMAQGGSTNGNGTGGSKNKIKGEFSSNGFTQNTLSHTRGVVSMARTEENDSATSQFFICYIDECAAAFDGSYAAFGKVIEGMETVDEFRQHEMALNSIGEKASPVEPIYIDTMVVV